LSGSSCSTVDCTSAAQAVPSCAQSCITSAGSAAGCAYTNFACQCSKSARIGSFATPCVEAACPASEYAPVMSSVSAVCRCVSAGGSGGTQRLGDLPNWQQQQQGQRLWL
jgi:hypothetical protein